MTLQQKASLYKLHMLEQLKHRKELEQQQKQTDEVPKKEPRNKKSRE